MFTVQVFSLSIGIPRQGDERDNGAICDYLWRCSM